MMMKNVACKSNLALIVKNCQREGVGVKNHENLSTSLMDGPLDKSNFYLQEFLEYVEFCFHP